MALAISIFGVAFPAVVLAIDAASSLLTALSMGRPGAMSKHLGLALFAFGLAAWFHVGFPWSVIGVGWRWVVLTPLAATGVLHCGLLGWLLLTGGGPDGHLSGWLTAAMGVGLLASCIWAIAAPQSGGVSIPLPVGGERWYVVHGGAMVLTNYHVRSFEQRYAVDLIHLGPHGRHRLPGPNTNESYSSFGQTVYAPVAGTIVLATDGQPDRRPGEIIRTDPAGNHVILETESGVRLVFAHLRSGSVKVVTGQAVVPGTVLGEVGNSGHSSEPHLHVHAMRRTDSGWEGIPLWFDGKRPLRGMVFRVNPDPGRW